MIIYGECPHLLLSNNKDYAWIWNYYNYDFHFLFILSHYLAESNLWEVQHWLMGKCCVGVSEVKVCLWVKGEKQSLDSKLPTALETQGWPKVTPSLQCKCKGALGFKHSNEKHQTSTETHNASQKWQHVIRPTTFNLYLNSVGWVH